MIDKECFISQIKRLEDAFQNQYWAGALPQWKKELSKFHNEDLECAVGTAIHEGRPYAPNLPAIIALCETAARRRVSSKSDDIMPDHHKEPRAAEVMSVILRLVSKEMSNVEAALFARSMDETNPGVGWADVAKKFEQKIICKGENHGHS